MHSAINTTKVEKVHGWWRGTAKACRGQHACCRGAASFRCIFTTCRKLYAISRPTSYSQFDIFTVLLASTRASVYIIRLRTLTLGSFTVSLSKQVLGRRKILSLLTVVLVVISIKALGGIRSCCRRSRYPLSASNTLRQLPKGGDSYSQQLWAPYEADARRIITGG